MIPFEKPRASRSSNAGSPDDPVLSRTQELGRPGRSRVGDKSLSHSDASGQGRVNATAAFASATDRPESRPRGTAMCRHAARGGVWASNIVQHNERSR